MKNNNSAEYQKGRMAVLSELTAIIGGWNASPPVSIGRLSSNIKEFENDDRQILHYLLKQYLHGETVAPNQRIQYLEALCFRLQEKIALLEAKK